MQYGVECGKAEVVNVKKTKSQKSDIQEGLDSKDNNDLIDRNRDIVLLTRLKELQLHSKP